jgi:hypothetical protein
MDAQSHVVRPALHKARLSALPGNEWMLDDVFIWSAASRVVNRRAVDLQFT